MREIKEIQEKIASLYNKAYKKDDNGNSSKDVPQRLQSLIWIIYAKDYLAAATIIYEANNYILLNPRMQLIGQAVESALKAYISATGSKPPISHDLVKLYEKVEEFGLTLDEPNKAWIIHVSHQYYKDISTGTNFKTRYPTNKMESTSASIPEHYKLAALIQLICNEAEKKNPFKFG